jgi:excisionase family DNA binding protein
MLTINEVSEILGVGVQTVKDWADKGRIEFTSKENEYYFEKEAVDKFISETGIKLIKPEDSQKAIESLMKTYCKDHNVVNIMKSEDIEKLIKDNSSK